MELNIQVMSEVLLVKNIIVIQQYILIIPLIKMLITIIMQDVWYQIKVHINLKEIIQI